MLDSLSKILDNDKTAISCHAGSVFPSANLMPGMLCFREDEDKLYQLKADGQTWGSVADFTPVNEAIALKANIASPTFTGAPKAPTAAKGTNTTQLATTAFVKTAVDAAVTTLLGDAPAEALDTLKEIGDALGNDANFASTMTKSLAGKLNLTGGTLTGALTGTTIAATTFTGALTGNASTATKLATARTLSLTGDATASMSFDGSANASATLTLANSGVTAGTYGSNVAVPAVTVDAKGRVTKVANTSIRAATTEQSGIVQLSDSLDSTSTALALTAAQGKVLKDTKREKVVSVTGAKIYENVASYYNPTTSATGAIVIHLPKVKNSSATMMKVKVQGFSYAADVSNWEVVVSGYNYIGQSWHQAAAAMNGNAPFTQVRLAHAEDHQVIIIGDVNTSWAYTRLRVAEFDAGYSNIDGWDTGWSIALETNLSIYKGVVTPNVWGTPRAKSADKLTTARTINGISFDGSANITIADSTKLPLTGGTLTGSLTLPSTASSWINGTSGATSSIKFSSAATASSWHAWAAQKTTNGNAFALGVLGENFHISYATSANIAAGTNATSQVVSVSASGVAISGTLSVSGTINGSVNGNAGTATKLATARTIGGVSFDGSANINLPGVNAAGNQSTTGNAATATKLATTRALTIGSTAKSFDGSDDVSWTLSEIGAAAADHSHGSEYMSAEGGTITGSLAVNGALTASSGIELIHATPFIDFHFGRSTADYTSRIIESASGSLTCQGNWTASGNVTAYSDRRLKSDIKTIPDALAKVEKLNGCTFTRKDTNLRQTGLIAQDVQVVLPEAVVEMNDEMKTLSVNYGSLVGLLVESIKELKLMVSEQAEVIKSMNSF